LRRRLVAAVAAALAAVANAAPAVALDADAVKERWRARLAGRHFGAVITMSVDRDGRREARRLQVWRDEPAPGKERLLARFEEPADLRGLAVLYLEHRDRPNDYFVYQPATRRVRRVGEAVAREDVYGIDLEYLGFGAAQIIPTEPESVEETSLDGRAVLRLTERATERHPRFDRRTVWLDAASLVPLRAEHERDGVAVLVATTREVREVQGVPTPMRVDFARPLDRQTIEMGIESVDYEAPIPASAFSTLELIK
jgi:hypothetical protein